MISLQERFFDYRWSSYRFYAAKAGRAGRNDMHKPVANYAVRNWHSELMCLLGSYIS